MNLREGGSSTVGTRGRWFCPVVAYIAEPDTQLMDAHEKLQDYCHLLYVGVFHTCVVLQSFSQNDTGHPENSLPRLEEKPKNDTRRPNVGMNTPQKSNLTLTHKHADDGL